MRSSSMLMLKVLALSFCQRTCTYAIPYIVYRAFGLSRGFSLGAAGAPGAVCDRCGLSAAARFSRKQQKTYFSGDLSGLWSGAGGAGHAFEPHHKLLFGGCCHWTDFPGWPAVQEKMEQRRRFAAL